MKQVRLSNGVMMPQLGFGVFQMDDLEQCREAVSAAISTGYRLFDTAAVYGNESAVGAAIKDSDQPRDHFFITSKLWVKDMQGDSPMKAIDASLRNLGTDYLDLYLIHMPFGDTFNAWRAMEKAYQAGKIRAIGVSNFTDDQVTNLSLFNDQRPMVNQLEVNPWNQRHETVDFNRSAKIQVVAWAPFAEGKHHLFSNPTLTAIANNHHKTVGNVALRWLMQRGIVAIPKSVHPNRIAENIAIFDFELSSDEMKAINGLDQDRSDFFNPRDPQAMKTIVSGGQPGANDN